MESMINIAIDGYSSCGKSTIAKAISRKYNMKYIDTGSMYRAITFYAIRHNIILNNKIDLSLLSLSLNDIDVDFNFNVDEGRSETYLNGLNIEGEIRRLEVSNNVSLIAEISMVREKLVKLQRNIGSQKNVVMDGRDIGTHVLPNAEIKFFITADIELRAKRRYNDLIMIDKNIQYLNVLDNLRKRDEIDTNRDISPLRMSNEAILIDTSELSIHDQSQFVFTHIDKFRNLED